MEGADFFELETTNWVFTHILFGRAALRPGHRPGALDASGQHHGDDQIHAYEAPPFKGFILSARQPASAFHIKYM